MASRQESVSSMRIYRHVVLELVDGELVGVVVAQPLSDEVHSDSPSNGQGGQRMATYQETESRGRRMDR